jgi:hypothetical protein
MKKIKIVSTLSVAAVAALVTVQPNSSGLIENHHFMGHRKPSNIRGWLKSMNNTLAMAPKAIASMNTQSSLEASKGAVGFVLGSKTHADYVKYQCDGTDPGEGNECDGPPKEGLVGKLADLTNDSVKEALQAAGYSTCSAIPNSGTSTSTDSDGASIALTFGTPTHTIPAAWVGGGTAYDKRIEFQVTLATQSTKMAVEVSCSYHSMYMASNMTVGSHAVGYNRPINVYGGKLSSGESVAHIFVSEEHTTTGGVRGAYAFNLKINDTSKQYQIWGAYTSHAGYSGLDRIAVTGNYSTDEASVNFKRWQYSNGGSSDFTGSTVAGFSGASTATIETSSTYALTTDLSTFSSAGSSIHHQGCINFASVSTAPSSATLCSGLSLSDPDAPVIDSTGAFSVQWLIQTMTSKMEKLSI